MLPDHLSRLLSVYVDGEASPSQQLAVERLLHQSAEARTLLEQLREDASRLRNLPRRPVEADLAATVWREIADQRAPLTRRLARTRVTSYPLWAGLAVAACALAVVGIGAFGYLDAVRRGQAEQAKVRQTERSLVQGEKPADVQPDNGTEKAAETPPRNELPQDLPPAPEIVQTEPLPDSGKPRSAPRERTKPAPDSQLAIPTPKPLDLQTVQPSVGLSLSLRDLDKNELKEQLRQNLRRANVLRMELFGLGNGKALQRLQNVLKARGVRLVVDPEVATRLKNRRVKTDYAIYVEGLTAEEWAKILERLGRMDREAEANNRHGDGQYEKLFVLPFSTVDRKEWAGLLGVDPVPASAKPKNPLGVDIRKPVSEGTATQVTQTLTGQGTARAEAGKAGAVKPSERLAVVMPYNPPRKASPPREIKQLLETRKDRPAGTVQVFLVVRGVNG